MPAAMMPGEGAEINASLNDPDTSPSELRELAALLRDRPAVHIADLGQRYGRLQQIDSLVAAHGLAAALQAAGGSA